jgi:hypothetical protein
MDFEQLTPPFKSFKVLQEKGFVFWVNYYSLSAYSICDPHKKWRRYFETGAVDICSLPS